MIDIICLWIGRLWLTSLAVTATGLALGLLAVWADRLGRNLFR